ncbi:MAG: hypothetical protein RBR08_14240 [Desulforegulaceae bacterium]|nr:hypothetical protein [Desulforegulaceae bacterium]
MSVELKIKDKIAMENPMSAELGDAVMNNRPETVEKAIRKLRGAVYVRKLIITQLKAGIQIFF